MALPGIADSCAVALSTARVPMCLCAQALLPALLLSALFLGITVGVAIFVRTRTFYKADDVLRVC